MQYIERTTPSLLGNVIPFNIASGFVNEKNQKLSMDSERNFSRPFSYQIQLNFNIYINKNLQFSSRHFFLPFQFDYLQFNFKMIEMP